MADPGGTDLSILTRSPSWRVVALVVGAYAGLVLLRPVQFWFDDPWFYLEIARHVLNGDGVTFSGLGWTNGYHPLWLAVVVPLLGFARLTGLGAPHVVVLVQAGLAFGVGMLLPRLSRQAGLPHPALSLGVGAITLLGAGLWGSEGWLDAVLQLAGFSLWLGACADRVPASRWALAGAVLGLAVLARLDLVFVGAAVCVATVLRSDVAVRDRVRDVLWLGGTFTLVLLPYLLANWIGTHHLVPVSGTVKSTFPVPDLHGVGAKLGVGGRNALIGGLLALGLGLRRRGAARLLLGAVGGGALAHGLYVAAFTGPLWSTDYDYYWVTGLLALSLSAGPLFALVTRLLPSFDDRARTRIGAVLGVLLALLGLIRTGVRAVGPTPPTVALGRWLAANLPPDAVVFTADAPGRLAWFSGHPVVAADGLTWGFDFSDTLRREGLAGWLDGLGTSYVVAPQFPYEVPWLHNVPEPDRIAMTVRDPWTGTAVGTLELPLDDALVSTATLVPGAGTDDVVGVWAYPPSSH